MSKKIILVGAGNVGRQALNFYGIRNVFCFADNFKSGTIINEKKVVEIEELAEFHKDYDVIISNESAFCELAAQLRKINISFGNYMDDYYDYQLKNRFCNKNILKLKNLHKGEKIFLIGNGPSLKVTDLENAGHNGYKTMACNFINKLFDKTKWRPDYYCCIEESAIALNKEFILSYPDIIKFIRGNFDNEHLIKESKSVHLLMYSIKCEISENLEYIIYDYNTLMFSMLQLALYMGFSEIYLIGVDNTQPPTVHTSDFIEANTHFYDEDINELEKRRSIMGHLSFENDYQEYQAHCNDGYICAKDYANSRGILIRNATRGGKLEIFERIDLDLLLNK